MPPARDKLGLEGAAISNAFADAIASAITQYPDVEPVMILGYAQEVLVDFAKVMFRDPTEMFVGLHAVIDDRKDTQLNKPMQALADEIRELEAAGRH